MLRALLRSLGLGLLLVTGAVLTPASAQETAASPSPGGVAFDLEALSVVPEVFPARYAVTVVHRGKTRRCVVMQEPNVGDELNFFWNAKLGWLTLIML